MKLVPPFRLATGGHLGYLYLMETVVKKFANAAEAERDFYRSLTCPQRMEIFFELFAQGRADDDKTAQGFPRVYRIVKRGGAVLKKSGGWRE